MYNQGGAFSFFIQRKWVRQACLILRWLIKVSCYTDEVLTGKRNSWIHFLVSFFNLVSISFHSVWHKINVSFVLFCAETYKRIVICTQYDNMTILSQQLYLSEYLTSNGWLTSQYNTTSSFNCSHL